MQSSGSRHPREMGVADGEAFLSMLAKDKLADHLAPQKVVPALLAVGAVSPLDSLLQV